MATEQPTSGPTSSEERLTSLDTIRGIAVLGILVINALSFGLYSASYFNAPADGISQPFDWVIAIFSMIFIDQKMMALFSLLFGVGVVIFAERAQAKGRSVIWLSLWRFAILFVVGIIHTAFWDGDVLLLYAVCAPIVLFLRNTRSWILATLGVIFALMGTFTAPLFQNIVSDDLSKLGDFWFIKAGEMSASVETWYILNATFRALGLMLIGVALYQHGIVQGKSNDRIYRRFALWGIGLGTAITSIGPIWRITTDWSAEYAITGTIPTGLGTIPMALGYMALIILWSRSGSRYVYLFNNTGKMALTNYLTQTVLGLSTLGWLLYDVDLSRTMIFVWILSVWALQLWWSTWWLTRFRYGPFEWAWRCATYRSWQPLRHLTQH